MDIKKIFVAGCGTMGNGIAQACAQCGYDVAMYDISSDGLKRALDTILKSVGRLVEKAKIKGTVEDITVRKNAERELQRERVAQVRARRLTSRNIA